MQFTQGQRVKTSLGCGTVCYQRMAPPSYSDAAAVSVLLDARRNGISYSGTILPARQVAPDDDPISVCRCCGYTAPWSAWTLNGMQDDDDDLEGEVLELRTCRGSKCENTQARQMPRR